MTVYHFLIGFSLLLSAIGLYCIKEDLRDLHQFRANLRPGELCRVRTSGGMVRARIVKRNSSISFVYIDIDTRLQHLTALICIYRP